MSPSSRKVYDFILVMSLISIACFVPSRNGDPTNHVDKHPTTWKSALDRCAGRGEQLVSIQNMSDKDKDRLLPKLEKDVPFWTMSIYISKVVSWAGCVKEASPNAFSLQDIGMQISLPKCLGYCLRRDKYAAVGLRADGMCMCFYDMKALPVPKYCDRNCSATVMDECEKNFVSLYKIVPTGEVLTAEEELLSTGKCVYFVNGANKHFKVSSCDRVMRGFRCQTHDGFHIYNISATWQEANIACRKAKMIMFWDHHQVVTGSFLWTGFFVSPTTINSPDNNAEGSNHSNCPIIWKTEKGNLKHGTDNCERSHHYLCIQDKKRVSHTGSSDRDSQIVGAVVGSLVAIILIAAVAVVIYRRRAKGRGMNKMIFDNRMYQEVMETDRLGCRPTIRNESNQVSIIHCDEKRMSNIYAAYAEITESHIQVEAKPRPAAANSKISQRVHGECLHYASSNITQLTGYTNISTITEQSGMRQTLVEDDNKPVAMAEKQTEKEYETIF